MIGCYEDEPVPARTSGGGSTVVVSRPGVTAPQPATTIVHEQPAPPQSAPPIIDNVVQPPANPAPAPTVTTAPAPGTTVNVQPRTVNVP